MADHEGFRNLHAWRKSIEFTTKIYTISQAFPKQEEFGLTNQIRRASISIASNVAEGHGRQMQGSFLHFIRIALGSANEVETQLIIAENLKYIHPDVNSQLLDEIHEIQRILHGLIKKLQEKPTPNTTY